MLNPAENREEVTLPGMQRLRVDTSVAPRVKSAAQALGGLTDRQTHRIDIVHDVHDGLQMNSRCQP